MSRAGMVRQRVGDLLEVREGRKYYYNGVLRFPEEGGAVRSRFDKVYTGPAGLFFLGHRSSDNEYHTLIELPPTK